MPNLTKILPRHRLLHLLLLSPGIVFLAVAAFLFYRNLTIESSLNSSNAQNTQVQQQLESVKKELTELQNEDQIKTNQDLRKTIASIQSTYNRAVSLYEDVLSFRDRGGKSAKLEATLAKALVELSQKNYEQATKTLDQLASDITSENQKLNVTLAAAIPASVPQSNTPPSSGYSRQQVNTDAGSFMVSMVAADLSSTKVIVDTASDGTCTDNCPVLPLATYVSRSGAFAGINGSYFCPASYPTCAGKTNSFDLLVMNKNKVYFNSDNNVYSTNPAVIFSSGSIRFVSQASQWGRDTGVDGVLSNYPLLVSGKSNVYGGSSDPKLTSKGGRSFVANQGGRVFIGVVHSATLSEAAKTLTALGMENALNLDNGGSTALWSGGYKVGPGRDLPNVILFVRK